MTKTQPARAMPFRSLKRRACSASVVCRTSKRPHHLILTCQPTSHKTDEGAAARRHLYGLKVSSHPLLHSVVSTHATVSSHPRGIPITRELKCNTAPIISTPHRCAHRLLSIVNS